MAILADMLNLSIQIEIEEYQVEQLLRIGMKSGRIDMGFIRIQAGSLTNLRFGEDTFRANYRRCLQHAFQDIYMSHKGETDLIDVDADVFVYELVRANLENPDLGLPYLSVL